MQVTLQYAQEHLPELAAAADSGEEVEIARHEMHPIRLQSTCPPIGRFVGELPVSRETQQRLHDELAWVAANRAQYAGRWIALLGANLLAVGDSAREVFHATERTFPAPLIIRVAQEDLPFAGW